MVEPRAAHLSPKPPLPDLHSTDAVAALVGLPPSKLAWWVWGFPRRKQYRSFQVTKKDGTARQILAPIPPIKRIQRQLATSLAAAYRAPAHVHGFTPGRSPLTNAAVHVDQRWIFALDLEDFFPTITAKRVHGLFRAQPFGYPEDVARLLARICCFQGALPQGAPTSPIVSNYICRGMDRELAALAMSHRCYYSRYADDLVFSTDRGIFPTSIAALENGIAQPSPSLRGTIERAGFEVNDRKTRMQIEFQRQRVTGLIVNRKVNVSRQYLRGLRALLHRWKYDGREEAAKALRRSSPNQNWPPGKPYPPLEAVVRGRVQYVRAVRGRNDPAYLKLARKLSELDPHFRGPSIIPGVDVEARLFTEGVTDPRHIRAALHHFKQRGEFTNLNLVISEDASRGGDTQLREYLQNLVEFGTDCLTVGLFDWDTSGAKQAVGPDGWREYGPQVVAVGLAPPSFRGELEPRCIELLYENSVLETKDTDGHRVYRVAEFNRTTSIHESEPCVLPHAKKKSEQLIAEEVYEVATNKQLARSKAAFARAIEKEPETFPTLSFEGFRPTFERIVVALASLPDDEENP